MNFGQPALLWLFLLLLPYIWISWKAEQRYRERLARWFPEGDGAKAGHAKHQGAPRQRRRSEGSVEGRPFFLLLRLLGLGLLILAAAQPRWGFEWREVKRHGADVVIALDVSRSMSATDIDPNRLERAKREIKDLLALAKGDRMALVLFSGVAFIQCPLTHDLGSFELFLDQASVESLPRQGTSMAAALTEAGRALDQGAEGETQGRAVILISDGEDHEGAALSIAEDLAKRSIKIHTIGVGGQGAPLPLPDGGFLKDKSGNLVVSRLNEGMLKELAQVGGGVYVRSETGDFDLERIYTEEVRPDLKERNYSTREKLWIERHGIFTAAALLLLLVESLLRRPIRQRARESKFATLSQAAKL